MPKTEPLVIQEGLPETVTSTKREKYLEFSQTKRRGSLAIPEKSPGTGENSGLLRNGNKSEVVGAKKQQVEKGMEGSHPVEGAL